MSIKVVNEDLERKLAHHLTPLLAGLSVTFRLVLSCCCSLRLFVATATLSFEELLNNFLKTAFILSSRLFVSSRLKELQFHLIIFFAHVYLATSTVYAITLYYFLSHHQHRILFLLLSLTRVHQTHNFFAVH